MSMRTANFDSLGSFEHVAKIEATRESEQLKSVLLDAITHDFRTPLTSIKASVTGFAWRLRIGARTAQRTSDYH